ncbi:DUF6259 domain-containing protein [Bacillaceae bacterium C204]|uniref:DUF6259 domain-containing protein n=1 Tax=Neobacillus sp. 204 TaxID=3383351 RepID=UPI00397BCC16
MILLENEHISISFSEATGSISGIYDKQKGIHYISSQRLPTDPFRVEIDGELISQFQRFSFTSIPPEENSHGVLFTWSLSDYLIVIAKVQLQNESNEVIFECEVQNQSDQSVSSLEYPIIPNITTITDGGSNDYLAHSFATGFKIHNPLKNFTEDSNGFRFMPYPEGFSGSTMQFFSYYGLEKGGLYFATYDQEAYLKWFNFYKNNNGLLEATFIHGCEDIGPQKGLKVSYPIIVKLLDGRDWYEAADIYKNWSVNQFWCQKGVLADVDEKHKATWLLEDIGVTTFGINAGHDRAEWIDHYHKYMNTKIFHILGPDWAGKTQDFCNCVPGGHDDWFPTRFNQANLDVMKSYDDKYAPFEFDYLFNINGADGEAGKKALQQIPKSPTKSIDHYPFPFVCPVDPFVQELHVRRDEKLQQDVNVDSIYYDISASNIMKTCMDPTHGHHVGAGRKVTMAYRKNYIDTKEAMIKAADDRYIPMGTEMMNEVFLDILDYYQARAGAQPAAPLEGWNIRELLMSGEAELIPMFTYVYHEYGAIRLDGWGKLVKEIGDLFYYTVARTYLWGGLYELNYEYSPMEAIAEKENRFEEHYYPFEQRGYPFDSERAQYLSKFANIRTGVGNKYLAYGRMLRPLEFECEKIGLNWFLYNCDKMFKEYNTSGELDVDAVVHSAWQYRDESIGLFFANVSDTQQQVEFKLNRTCYQLQSQQLTIRMHTDKGVEELFVLEPNEERCVSIFLPKKNVVLIELS